MDEVIQLVVWDNRRVHHVRLGWNSGKEIQLVVLGFGSYYRRTIRISRRGSRQGRRIAACGWRVVRFSCQIEQ